MIDNIVIVNARTNIRKFTISKCRKLPENIRVFYRGDIRAVLLRAFVRYDRAHFLRRKVPARYGFLHQNE